MSIEQVRQIFKDYAEPNSYVDSGNLYWALGVALQAIAEAEKQEPAAWRTEVKHGKLFFHIGVQSFLIDYTGTKEEIAWMEKQLQDALSKLASPPQRQWVGLTADELNMIWDRMKTWNSHSWTDIYIAIEAKLKEKNGIKGEA
jgi:hypothetical protein